jgi:hypothetical protein
MPDACAATFVGIAAAKLRLQLLEGSFDLIYEDVEGAN